MPPKKPNSGPIPKEAIAFFEVKGVRPGFSYREVWDEEHAYAFTVAKMLERDILTDVQKSLLEALEQGIPFEEWAASVKELFDRSGWSEYNKAIAKLHRLDIIYSTNMRTSRAVGQWDRAQRVKKVLPFFLYCLGPSAKHRAQHVSWEGLILPVDDPFWDSAYPPSGYRCKCHLRQITKVAADRRGGESDRPSEKKVPWKDPRTGKTVLVLDGVHPTFAHNPGKAAKRRKATRQADLNSRFRAEEVSKQLEKQGVKVPRKIKKPERGPPPPKRGG